jgi:hypothetical protein
VPDIKRNLPLPTPLYHKRRGPRAWRSADNFEDMENSKLILQMENICRGFRVGHVGVPDI